MMEFILKAASISSVGCELNIHMVEVGDQEDHAV